MATSLRSITSLLIASALFAFAQPASQSGRTIVHPQDHKKALLNPGMGWSLHHYDNDIKKYGLDLEPSDLCQQERPFGELHQAPSGQLSWSSTPPGGERPDSGN
jgi:hypothetical protein